MVEFLRVLAFGVAAAVTLPASGAEPQPPPRTIAPPTRIPPVETVTPLPAGEPVSAAQLPRDVRRAVVVDAARRFKVAESAVVLTRAEQITWRDGSLGCPESRGVYSQNLVPGFRVVARTGEGELTYHTDSRGYAVSCGVLPQQLLDDRAGKVVKPVEPRTDPPPARTAKDR